MDVAELIHTGVGATVRFEQLFVFVGASEAHRGIVMLLSTQRIKFLGAVCGWGWAWSWGFVRHAELGLFGNSAIGLYGFVVVLFEALVAFGFVSSDCFAIVYHHLLTLGLWWDRTRWRWRFWRWSLAKLFNLGVGAVSGFCLVGVVGYARNTLGVVLTVYFTVLFEDLVALRGRFRWSRAVAKLCFQLLEREREKWCGQDAKEVEGEWVGGGGERERARERGGGGGRRKRASEMDLPPCMSCSSVR
jgi:hypothetical protein